MLAFSGLAAPKKYVQLPAASQRTRRSSVIVKQVRLLARKGHYKSVDEILHTLDRAPKGYKPPLDDYNTQGAATPPSSTSVRFPCHVFVHQLLGDKKPVRAGRKLEWMIEGDVRVRTKTFHVTTSTLLNKSPKFTIKEADPPMPSNTATQKLDETTGMCSFALEMIRDEFCWQAVSLLQLARTHGVKREMWMYERVIDGIMLQGQYVEAALLFDMLAKDWQIQCTLEEAFSASALPLSPQSKLYLLHTILAASSLPPSSDLLHRILKPIVDMFGRIKTYRRRPSISYGMFVDIFNV